MLCLWIQGFRALDKAISKNCIASIQCLLANGADVNIAAEVFEMLTDVADQFR